VARITNPKTRILALFFVLFLKTIVLAQNAPQGFYFEKVAQTAQFNVAVGMAIAPDGRIFVCEQAGAVYIIENNIRLETPFIDLSDEALQHWDRGLLGIALAPDFEATQHVYLTYVVDHGSLGDFERTDAYGRVTRYTASAINPNIADLATRKVLIGADYASGVPTCFFSHSIGTLRFGMDGSLLIGTGDGASFLTTDAGGLYPDCFGSPEKFDSSEDIGAFRSQKRSSYAGKILRVDPETGQGLPSNPYYTGDASEIESKVWAYGLRNPFRFHLMNDGHTEPDSAKPGSIVIGDVGDFNWEEINISTGGENFGWPCFEGLLAHNSYQNAAEPGQCPDEQEVTPPIAYWSHNEASQSNPPGRMANSITMGSFYAGTKYPAEYQNSFFFADFTREWAAVAKIDEHKRFISEKLFSNNIGSVTDFAYNPQDEYIYLIKLDIGNANSSGVFKIVYDEDVSVESRIEETPGSITLTQNYPNPFNPSTTIIYTLNRTAKVLLKVFDLCGREVATLVNQVLPTGTHKTVFHAGNLPGGVYFYQLTAGHFRKAQKIVLLP